MQESWFQPQHPPTQGNLADEAVLKKIQIYACVVDTVGRQCHSNQSDLRKDVTNCVIYTSGIFAAVSTTSDVNLPPVSLILSK
jgi:hypothetical protein